MSRIIVVLLAGLAFAGPMKEQPELRGTVRETIDAGGYTYVRIATKAGDEWAAIVRTPLKVGAKITVAQDMVMDNFESKTLGRKFKRVAFGAIEAPTVSSPHSSGSGPHAAASDPHAGLSQKAEAAPGPVKPLAKAEGPDARTVAEVYADKGRLKGKEVAVRGQVVKCNRRIMGSNWIHLRDGSGSRKGKDDDLAVTTQDSAAAGDIVTVRGVVELDKDVGSGYFFPVLVEKAKIVK